jgi:HPt (histidine-containing phosphotransfer) domain-containing protein
MSDSYETPIDVDDLLKRCLGEMSFLSDILNEFLESSEAEIEKLSEMAAAESDQEQLRVQAHRLRGTAATVSAENLTEELRTIERLASEGQLENVPQHVDNVKKEFNRIKEFIATGIGASFEPK